MVANVFISAKERVQHIGVDLTEKMQYSASSSQARTNVGGNHDIVYPDQVFSHEATSSSNN